MAGVNEDESNCNEDISKNGGSTGWFGQDPDSPGLVSEKQKLDKLNEGKDKLAQELAIMRPEEGIEGNLMNEAVLHVNFDEGRNRYVSPISSTSTVSTVMTSDTRRETQQTGTLLVGSTNNGHRNTIMHASDTTQTDTGHINFDDSCIEIHTSTPNTTLNDNSLTHIPTIRQERERVVTEPTTHIDVQTSIDNNVNAEITVQANTQQLTNGNMELLACLSVLIKENQDKLIQKLDEDREKDKAEARENREQDKEEAKNNQNKLEQKIEKGYNRLENKIEQSRECVNELKIELKMLNERMERDKQEILEGQKIAFDSFRDKVTESVLETKPAKMEVQELPIVHLMPIVKEEGLTKIVDQMLAGAWTVLIGELQIFQSVLNQVNKEGEYIEILTYPKERKFVDFLGSRLMFDHVDREKYECVLLERLKVPIVNMEDYKFAWLNYEATKKSTEYVKNKMMQNHVNEMMEIQMKKLSLAYNEIKKSEREKISVVQNKYQHLKQVTNQVKEEIKKWFEIIQLIRKEPEKIVIQKVFTKNEVIEYMSTMKEGCSLFGVVDVDEIKKWVVELNKIHDGIKVIDSGEDAICCWLNNNLLMLPIVDKTKYRFVRIDKLSDFKANPIDALYFDLTKTCKIGPKAKIVGRDVSYKMAIKDLHDVGCDTSDRNIAKQFVSNLWVRCNINTDQLASLKCRNWIPSKLVGKPVTKIMRRECNYLNFEKRANDVNVWSKNDFSEGKNVRKNQVKMKNCDELRRTRKSVINRYQSGGGRPRYKICQDVKIENTCHNELSREKCSSHNGLREFKKNIVLRGGDYSLLARRGGSNCKMKRKEVRPYRKREIDHLRKRDKLVYIKKKQNKRQFYSNNEFGPMPRVRYKLF